MRWYYGWQSHTEANFACASGQFRAKPPVFCKHAARTIIWIKKMRTALTNLRIYAAHVLNKCSPTTLRMVQSNPIQSHKTVPVKWYLKKVKSRTYLSRFIESQPCFWRNFHKDQDLWKFPANNSMYFILVKIQSGLFLICLKSCCLLAKASTVKIYKQNYTCSVLCTCMVLVCYPPSDLPKKEDIWLLLCN